MIVRGAVFVDTICLVLKVSKYCNVHNFHKEFRILTRQTTGQFSPLLQSILNEASWADFPLSSTVFQVQDAQATMRLYTLVKKQWEAEIKASHKNKDSDKKTKRKPKLPKNKGKNLMGL